MTSISKLIIGGFKSIRERTEIPIAPITFLFGPNSAGKSAVLGAVRALLRRIEEPGVEQDNNFWDRPPLAIASGTAYKGPDRVAYADDDIPLGSYPNVTLGVEIEDFSSSLGRCFDKLDSFSAFAGRALYWAIDGASVSTEILEVFIDEQFRDSVSSIDVDQVPLLEFCTSGLVHNLDLPLQLQFANWQSEHTYGIGLKLLGCVSINVAHPVWAMASITDGSTNFNRLPDEEAAVKHDQYRIQLRERLHHLFSVASNTASPFIQQVLKADGDWLRIRTHVDFLSCKQWSPELFYSNSITSFPDFWRSAGLNVEEEAKNMLLIEQVNTVLVALSYFGSGVRDSVAEALHVTAVDGDRQVLKPADVSVQLPVSKIRSLESSEIWSNRWTTTKSKNETNYSDTGVNVGSYLPLYAFWLGCTVARVSERLLDQNPKYQAMLSRWGTASTVSEKLLDQILKRPLRSDFVNYVLKKGIFGGNRYEVKPIVSAITTKQLTYRNPEEAEKNEDDWEDTEIKVDLFLEDQNGRRLDFSEVGSGISYVMPILASLHGAKTSWIAQPELHLHPAAQCEMGDVFLRAGKLGHYSVVETHSEHLLLRVLRRIRQTTNGTVIDEDLKCPPEAVSVLYFDPQEDGSTKIKQMRVSRLGDFKDRWPNGFFEERGRELLDE